MIDKELTRHLAELSALALTEDEITDMTADMTDIISLMDKVRGAGDTAASIPAVGYDRLRSDEPLPSSPTEDILKNAKSGSFAALRVVQ